MRALLSGAAIAAVAGMLMGAAAKPDLSGDDRPAGPQMLSTAHGLRAAGPFADDSLAFAAYAGKLPDYVIGTDTTKAMNAYPTAYVPPPIKLAEQDDPPADPPVTHVAYDDSPPPAPNYPSVDGGQAQASTPAPSDPAPAAG